MHHPCPTCAAPPVLQGGVIVQESSVVEDSDPLLNKCSLPCRGADPMYGGFVIVLEFKCSAEAQHRYRVKYNCTVCAAEPYYDSTRPEVPAPNT